MKGSGGTGVLHRISTMAVKALLFRYLAFSAECRSSAYTVHAIPGNTTGA
jgi:hypothetical protein